MFSKPSSAKILSLMPESALKKIEMVSVDARSLKNKHSRSEIQGVRWRPSSYPYISGDTFSAVANFIISSDSEPAHISGFRPIVRGESVFCEIDFLRKAGAVQALNRWFEASSRCERFERVPLILHNSDTPPSSEILWELTSEGWTVFCVNLLDQQDHQIPIPIGLENLHLGINGNLSAFNSFRAERMKALSRFRSIPVFSSFNEATNPKVRGKLKMAVSRSRHEHFPNRLTPSEYGAAVRDSMFVLSPPGNGFDCHRTWEAIYLGAVPVILRGTLAESLYRPLPILVIDDWAEILDRTDTELEELFHSLSTKSTATADMSFWIDQLAKLR